jgi:acyl-CoA dehydrogenase
LRANWFIYKLYRGLSRSYLSLISRVKPPSAEETPVTYRSPVADILFSLVHVAGLDKAVGEGLFGEFDMDTAASVVEEAGRFATDVIAPLNRIGDLQGARYENGAVSSPPGFRDAYRAWAAGGWAGVTGAPEYGGMGLPHTINAACTELWNGASMGFALCPLLSEGAIGALNAYASEELRGLYLGKLISGEWTGTMNLTEPQAGSDLNAVKTRAERRPDGTYRVYGQKIFITYGEHDMADNIVHLVLARLPDAPAGTRGLSLFLVPKLLVKPDGSLGARNDVRCASIEHKLGIHASPTCVMIYGDAEGAVGWLVGQENRGLAAMFVMMNSARLAVGMQGVGIADRALQQALSYARDRRQGRGPKGGAEMSPIIEHADVQRMLLTMKALTHAARGVCHLTAVAIDRSLHGLNEAERRKAGERAALLTPIAKAFSTDIGDEVATLGVQIHGGMGYIEETGAAQHMRDARIAAIYEGANGVQAIDLAQRKLPLSDGAIVAEEIAGMRAVAADVAAHGGAEFGSAAARLGEAIDALERATKFMAQALRADVQDALAGATPYLRLFGLALGGACLAKAGLAAQALSRDGDASQTGRVALARFFAEKLSPGAAGLEAAIASGAGALQHYESALGA